MYQFIRLTHKRLKEPGFGNEIRAAICIENVRLASQPEVPLLE